VVIGLLTFCCAFAKFQSIFVDKLSFGPFLATERIVMAKRMSGNCYAETAYFPLVDALRGLAAFSVLTLHVIHHANWSSFPTTGILASLRHGNQGVDLFFVISGFVVLYNAFGIMAKYDGRFRAVFLVRRLARIAPLYYLTLLVSLLLVDTSILAIPNRLDHIVSHIFFYHTYSSDTFSSINGVNWSIAIEMHFYLFVFLFAPFISRLSPAIIMILAFIMAWSWRYYAFCHVDPLDPFRIYHIFIHATQIPGTIDEFALGMILALFLRQYRPSEMQWNELWSIPLCVISVSLLYWANSSIYDGLSEATQFAVRQTLLGVAFSTLLMSACLIKSQLIIDVALPIRYLGKIGYGIYLWHLPVIMLLKGHDLSPIVFYIATLIGAITLASASWYLFESPINKLARRWESAVTLRSRMIRLDGEVELQRGLQP
jgi:peptidoglycan/LPS O-acetylase OafA/YrhL